ncbi:MAG: fused MFS/spermidine synthase [Candidatus Micrarchaeota archaeon]
MEREYLERLAHMLEAIQSLEGRLGNDAKSAAAFKRLRSLAREAPAPLKSIRPSIEWGALEAIGDFGSTQKKHSPDGMLQRVKSAILNEFNLDSGTLVYAERTDSSFAAIFDSSLDGRPVRCLYMDGVLSSAEFSGGSPALLYPPFVMRSFEMLKNPSHGLVIGVAGGTMMEVLKRAFPAIHVDGVDIDKEIISLGKKFFSLKEDGRTSLHIADGRKFIRSAGKKYSIIVIDALCGISPVPDMATVEFASEVKSAMGPGGVCAINIIAKVERGGYLQFAYDTWRSVFRNVFVLPLCKEGELFNVVLIATDADSKGFGKQNSDAIYPMDFDPSRVFTDHDNRVRELSPY